MIPQSLLDTLPADAVVREHPEVPGLYLVTRPFIVQMPHPRDGLAKIEFPTETVIVTSEGKIVGNYDKGSPWVARQITTELRSKSVTVTTDAGPVTVEIADIFAVLGNLFRTWWDEDRQADAAREAESGQPPRAPVAAPAADVPA